MVASSGRFVQMASTPHQQSHHNNEEPQYPGEEYKGKSRSRTTGPIIKMTPSPELVTRAKSERFFGPWAEEERVSAKQNPLAYSAKPVRLYEAQQAPRPRKQVTFFKTVGFRS